MLKKSKHAYFFLSFPRKKVTAFFSDKFYNLGFHNISAKRLQSNRRIFLKSFAIEYKKLVCAQQPHRVKVVLVNLGLTGRGAVNFKSALDGVDGMFTKKRNLPLAVFTADCLSIFLFDPISESIGILHAGWKGTHKKIVEKAVTRMQKLFGTKPQDLLVSFGPSIRKCCYEVGSNFKKYFPSDLTRRKDKFYLDLAGANLKQLVNKGVKNKNIFDSRICTSCRNNDFFSYRREKDRAGRMMSLIMLK